MRLVDTLNYARQNLGRAKLRTSLTAIGIAIGTAAVVTLLAFAQGVQAISVRQASTFGQVTSVDVAQDPKAQPPKPITPAVVARLRALPGVIDVSETVLAPPLRVTVAGKSIDLYASAVAAKGFASKGDTIFIPAGAATSLGLAPQAAAGATATVTAGADVRPAGRTTSTFIAGPDRVFPVKVGGTWNDKALAPDARGTAPVLLTPDLAARIDGVLSGQTADEYLNQSGYSDARLTTADATRTKGVADQVTAMGFLARTQADLLKRLDTFFLILQVGLGTIGGIALIVAAVGIANTMITTVLERTREIGIMKALGAEPRTIRLMFLAETALVGLLGGVFGLLLSFAGGAVGQFVFVRVIQSQNPGFDPGALFLFPIQLLLVGLGLAVGVSLLGGALPSRRAARLQPLDALRYE